MVKTLAVTCFLFLWCFFGLSSPCCIVLLKNKWAKVHENLCCWERNSCMRNGCAVMKRWIKKFCETLTHWKITGKKTFFWSKSSPPYKCLFPFLLWCLIKFWKSWTSLTFQMEKVSTENEKEALLGVSQKCLMIYTFSFNTNMKVKKESPVVSHLHVHVSL